MLRAEMLPSVPTAVADQIIRHCVVKGEGGGGRGYYYIMSPGAKKISLRQMSSVSLKQLLTGARPCVKVSNRVVREAEYVLFNLFRWLIHV